MKACTVIPGLSDYEVVLADCDIRAASARKQPRSVFKWDKADWSKIKKDLAALRDSFIPAYGSRSVEENHNCLMDQISLSMKSFIPTKLLKAKQSAPWFNNSIKRMCKKKQRLFSAARKTGKPSAWMRYKAFKRDTLKAIRRARWSYLNDVLSLSLGEGNFKPFWQYIRAQRQDNIVISALKENGNLVSDALGKADNRPVSLTCVLCKILEHIIAKHYRDYLERHGILNSLNHGFRSKFSCETQLLLTLQDLLTFRDRKIQVDIAILDFSKAFDTVPHGHLLGKLQFYGMHGPLLDWTASFLKTRTQSMAASPINASFSGSHPNHYTFIFVLLMHALGVFVLVMKMSCVILGKINYYYYY